MKRTTPKAYHVGDPVLVVGNLCTVKTCVGLFGYVRKVWTPEEARKPEPVYWLTLLDYPTLDGWDADNLRRGEARGDFKTWSASGFASQLRPLTGAARLARVAKMRAKEQAEDAKPRDPKLQALFDSIDANADANHRQEAEIKDEIARLGNVFPLLGRIERGDKSEFAAYHSPEAKAITSERDGYAYRPKGRSECTITEQARWRLANDALDCFSFWSPDPDVRALVKELDLDPFADDHAPALYVDRGWVFAKRADLRREAIKLWNRGTLITKINEAEDAETAWSDYKGQTCPGFFLHYATRRKLPIPA